MSRKETVSLLAELPKGADVVYMEQYRRRDRSRQAELARTRARKLERIRALQAVQEFIAEHSCEW